MKRYLLLLAAVAVAALAFPSIASAQSGHFVGTPSCTDNGTTFTCTGKVAGLGGTTFDISATGSGIGSVTCTNSGGNVAPGQNTSVTATGSLGPAPTPDNGKFNFSLESAEPGPIVPAKPTCPNNKWTANVTDVAFGDVTLTLTEDGVPSDSITVPVT